MNLQNITAEFIENILKNWQKNSFTVEDIETLTPWLQNTITPDEKRLALRGKLYQFVLDQLPEHCVHSAEANNDEGKLHALRKLFQYSPSKAGYLALIYCRYLDIQKHSITQLAKTIGVSEKTLRRYIVKGFEAISLDIKTELIELSRSQTLPKPDGNIPLMNAAEVIGIEDSVQEIAAWLRDPIRFSAVSIEGIGGIGKTLLARQVWQELSKREDFDGFVWVSARQKELSASGEIARVEGFASTLDDVAARLAHQLGQAHLAGFCTADKLAGLQKLSSQNRLLIVLDNLETVEDVDQLIPAMLELTGPSKVLTTSRKSLSKFPQVRIFPTPELSLADSHQLILNETNRRGIRLPLAQDTITALYELTGGVPLALKLAAAQFGFVSAKEIIEQLRAGEKKSENLYAYVYQQAWELLDDQGKKLLLAMLTVSADGEDREWICAINGIDDDEFEQGLQQLQRLSLLEFSGNVETPRYRIHRLTTTFLQSNILGKWSGK